MRFVNGHPECIGCGTCKMQAVLDAPAHAGPVAFVGEGQTDRYGALYADVTFAKLELVAHCERDGVPYVPWNAFDDVRAWLESDADPARSGRAGTLSRMDAPARSDRAARRPDRPRDDLGRRRYRSPSWSPAWSSTDDGMIEIDREDIEVDWARPAFDLATESIGVFDGDRW